jgi:hypothetical protein
VISCTKFRVEAYFDPSNPTTNIASTKPIFPSTNATFDLENLWVQVYLIFTMTSEEIEESQSGIEESGMGGPGAPTPLSALEVQVVVIASISTSDVSS